MRLLRQQVSVHDSIIKPIERHYQYNQAGELTKMTDMHKGIKTYIHDLKGRLASASYKPYTDKNLPDEISCHQQCKTDPLTSFIITTKD